MGVTGLWTVVQPCARPIKLETLNKKRLAVDASIWIYQFLKAVRDKEGHALRNAHVVGFFRRICKLLYFGIKPVFVFDGGAPALKRQTIAARKSRREGRRDDAARTAGKLLAVQMHRRVEEEKAKRTENIRDEQPEEELPENLVYVDEIQMTPKERQQNRQFRKQDAYHLPELDVSLESMGAPDDPRIMSHEELEEYARQFHSGRDINLYDFSKIDFDSPFFLSLPASDRYNILNAARLRSRLRMGYSKEQLDTMFPDRMAFSKFQIERVRERNNLTQRLMNINGMNDDLSMYDIGTGSRIAGEKGREYVLVKDSEVEGGWALGVLGNKEEGQRDKPIDVDQYGNPPPAAEKGWEDEEDGFEDVPIEGLNRLSKLPMLEPGIFDESLNEQAQEVADMRRAVYESRQLAAGADSGSLNDPNDDGLFVEDETSSVNKSSNRADDQIQEESDDQDLDRAIQLSLEEDPDKDGKAHDKNSEIPNVDGNNRKDSMGSIYSDDNDGMDFSAAIAQSKVAKKLTTSGPPSHPFDGPLPFESIKFERITGLERKSPGKEAVGSSSGPGRSKTEKYHDDQLPPWFAGSSANEHFIAREPEDQFSGVDRYRETTDATNKSSAHMPQEVAIVEEAPENQGYKSHPSQKVPWGESAVSKNMKDSDADQSETTANAELAAPANTTPGTIFEINALHTPMKDSVVNAEPANDEASRKGDTSRMDAPSPDPDFEDVDISKPPEKFSDTLDPSNVFPHNQAEQQNEAIPIYPEEDEYSDPEDEELLHQLATEAEEHARFASSLNSKSQAENAYDYEKELKQLRSQQKKDRRDADEVTQIMITECQHLLQLFGLPYITAPMEAEAQCAELVSLGLVDGIVTDDSDTFLFGGTRVYKNMFNQAKYVECYLASDLEKEYALDRKKLISFAHLLGSDYTEGIPGVGPVTALEILTEFPSLADFTEWWSQMQRGVKVDTHAAFRKKFKKSLTKIFLPPDFPDKRVETAYLKPEVDSDPSDFQWGVPDLNAVRQFLMSTIGWSPQRTDEVLVPVIRDANRREQEGTQANITNFFSGPQGAGAFAPRRRPDGTSRMEKAFHRLRKEAESKQQVPESSVADEVISVDDGTNGTDNDTRAKKGTRKRAKSKVENENVSGDTDNIDLNAGGGQASRKSLKKRKAVK